MKTKILSLVLLTSTFSWSLQAQITVNSNNVISIGDEVEQATDANAPGITIGANGATSWDFSSLVEDDLDILKFVSPSGLPGSNSFPAANLGLIEEDSSWIYLTKNNSELKINGIYEIEDGEANSIPITSTIITFPSTYQTSFTESWSAILGIFPIGVDPDSLSPAVNGPHGRVDSLKLTRTANISSNMDAWGDVTTPLGTFPSLRQNTIENNSDTAWQYVNGVWEIISNTSITALSLIGIDIDAVSNDTLRTVKWWTNDAATKFPIIEMDYNIDGAVNEVKWQKSSPTVSLNEVETITNVFTYPNPAINEITIDVSKYINKNLEVLDVTGKIINNVNFTSNKVKLSLTDYNSGLYFYNIKDVNNNILYTNKFVVAK